MAKTRAIEGERSLPQLRHITGLCHRFKTHVEGNPTPPPTSPALQQEYAIDKTTEECNTDVANQHQSGVNFHQSLCVTPAEADHSRDSPAVTHNAESSATITYLGARSAQTGDCRPSHLTCSAGSLTLAEVAGTGLSGGQAETNNAISGQGREGASATAHCVAPDMGLRTGLSNSTGNISYY